LSEDYWNSDRQWPINKQLLYVFEEFDENEGSFFRNIIDSSAVKKERPKYAGSSFVFYFYSPLPLNEPVIPRCLFAFVGQSEYLCSLLVWNRRNRYRLHALSGVCQWKGLLCASAVFRPP
jgi:hypothetical protein